MKPRLGALGLVAAGMLAAFPPAYAEKARDLYFGEALYFALQEQYFEALERLDTEVRLHDGVDEPELDSLYWHIDTAHFSLGDFELRYRMHHRAGRAIRAVLEAAVDDRIRNDAAFRLARIHFNKGQLDDATHALQRIEGDVERSIQDDIEFLRAHVFLGQENPQAAIDPLRGLQNSKEFEGLAAYNLGIAYMRSGQALAAVEQLDRAGQIHAGDEPSQAIRDKANLVLGTMLLEDGDFNRAAEFFNRVSLEGPFSNQALLSSGWANMSAERFDRAVVPWGILSEREVTDFAAQEALLALPYAYGKLEVHGRAALLYGQALDAFSAEIEKLTASIESIRGGKFLSALVREEIRNDKDWVIRLRALPNTPETYYLMELMASHDFQTGLQNYLDLADLRNKLETWQSDFDAYEDLVQIRHDHYEPLLPEVDAEFRELDSRLRLRREQHKMLVKRRNELLTVPRPEFLATREEQGDLQVIDTAAAQFADNADPDDFMVRRLMRLRGLITFKLATEYHNRLAEFDRNLRNLDATMAEAQQQYDAFVRARQAASHSYDGYNQPIDQLRVRVSQGIRSIDTLMARQGHLLEVVAIDVLVARRARLEDFSDKARFALADSYDRAAQRQVRNED